MSITDKKDKTTISVTSVISGDDQSYEANKGWFNNFIDSFKPADVDKIGMNVDEFEKLTVVEKANVVAANAPLKRALKKRHLQMIAIGGSIGTGLFIGSGGALATGGPAALVIAWTLTGMAMFCTVQALGELCVAFPVAGSFVQYNTRFVSPAWGFCMSWNYALAWLVTLPLELVAAAITIDFWDSSINSAAWVTIFLVLIMFINIFGIKGFGEAEFVFCLIKVIAIIGYIILGIILNCGGGPKGEYIGAKYWHNPGAFASGFKGVCTVFVTSAFSFGGTELVGLAASESENPRKMLPSATKQVFWRICLFYLISLTLIGFNVPYNDERLLHNSGAAASPFVISIVNAGIKGLPSVMNAVIIVAICSVCNSAVFAASRTIASLSDQGYAPKFFGYIDRQGRPLVGVGISFLFGFLCYLAASENHSTIFTWMLSISALSSIITWGSICGCHIRFRMALKAQGRDTGELTYTAQTGVLGSWFGMILNALIVVANFWVALFPGSEADAESFFQTFLCVPVLIVFYLFWLFYTKDFNFFVSPADIDIDTGRREVDLELLKHEIAEEKAEIAARPFYYRLYKFWC
ncbi:hypothetical protein CANINC_001337 [Pichia inconspicua]|uniref:Amino acid permease/ SLC12A domain-containing protein n=1 Tax=Pichia inconspicua TaxID=52247 RepID=A0A4T0X3S3_9ASCO|nr:hypothetical protein CANINC_001337 [[Candida] inconspicua]